MRMISLKRRCVTCLKASSFLMTFILITRRLVQDDGDLKVVTFRPITDNGSVTKGAQVPYQVVLEAKPTQKSYKNNNNDIIINNTGNNTINNQSTIIPGLYRVRGFSYDMFLFSVVIGNSSSSRPWDNIVIQGWEHRMYENSTFGCCIKYSSGIMLAVNMTRKIHWAYRHHVQMPVKQYLCPNTRYDLNDLPEVVTISGGTKETACHKRYNWYLAPYFAYEHKQGIAVCTKLVYGGISADDLLTWFEIHRRMGVNKVLTYTYKLNPEATRVLDHYREEGMVETFPFRLPKASRGRKVVEIGVKNMQAWNDEQIPVYDCQEKLKGYKYLVVVDLDEYLVPKGGKTWPELFDNLWKRRPYAAGFTFLVQLHITTWGVTSNSSQFKIGQYINRTSAMMDRMKHVTIPERLTPGGLSTHQFTPDWGRKYNRFMAKENEATIHHYRSCRKDWTKKNNNTCITMTKYTDTSVADLLAPIEKDILYLKNVLALNNG